MFGMLKTVLGNFFSRPATRLYPFEKREPYPGARGKLVIDEENCILCSICAKQCPSNCIVVNREEGYWELDAFRCVICGVCVEKCPKKCLSLEAQYREPGDKIVDRAYPPKKEKAIEKKVEAAIEKNEEKKVDILSKES